MPEIERPGQVKVPDDYERDKLNLGTPDWHGDRRLILYPGEVHTVDLSDRVIQHYLDGGDLVLVEEKSEEGPFEDRLSDLPGIGPSRAGDIAEDFATYEDFEDEVDAEYLSEIGLGASDVDEVLEELGKSGEEEGDKE